MTLIKVIFSRSRPQFTRNGNPYPDHNFLLPSWIWIIFHTFIVYNQECVMTMTQGLMPRSLHTHTQNPRLGHNSSIQIWIWKIFHTLIVHDLDVKTLTQDVITKVTVHIYPYSCPDHTSTLTCLILITFHTLIVHNQWCVMTLTQGHKAPLILTVNDSIRTFDSLVIEFRYLLVN